MLDLDHGSGRTLYDGRPYRAIRHPVCRIGVLLDAKAYHPSRSARDHLFVAVLLTTAGILFNRRDA